MTISSSLNASVAGLSVNASKLATISDNIANASTFGYKRAVSEFSSMVLTQGTGRYTAGGVATQTFRDVGVQGAITTSSNATDIAVAGSGFLPITNLNQIDNAGGNPPLQLTSTGSFRANEDGFLTTQTNQVLMGWPADANGVIAGVSRDSPQDLRPVQVTFNQNAANPTRNIALGVNLPAEETQDGAAATPQTEGILYFDNLGAAQTLDVTFTPTPPPVGGPATNEWTISFADSQSAANPIASFTFVFDATQGAGGTIASVTPIAGGTYDAATGLLSISVNNGTDPISIDVGVPGQVGQITQLSDVYSPFGITKDGSGVGQLASVSIDENGFLIADYTEGFQRTLYQIPLADVANPNGLTPRDNQAFELSSNSGPVYFWDAGDGPTGTTLGFAREQSATDVAGELTELIQTQRAYSSNAKIVQTVDEMLQETTNLKR